MRIHNWACLAILFLTLGCHAGLAQQQTSTDGSANRENRPDSESKIDPEARAILMRMSELLSKSQQFRVMINGAYDVVQENGEKIEFGERRLVSLSRPDHLRVELRESDGHQDSMIFDGKALIMFDPAANAYGQVELPGTVDNAVKRLVQDMKVRLPLALLLVTTLPEELDRRVRSLAYVERNQLGEVATDHLAARADSVDFQVWVSSGDKPLPQRVIITYKDDEGAPQYRAQFSDWNLTPELSASSFAFAPPAGAERLPILVRVRDDKAAPAAASDPSAGQKTPGSSGGVK